MIPYFMTQISDVAGGASASMLDTIRHTMDVSAHLNLLDGHHRPVHWKEAFYLATLGGAEGIQGNRRIFSRTLIYKY